MGWRLPTAWELLEVVLHAAGEGVRTLPVCAVVSMGRRNTEIETTYK